MVTVVTHSEQETETLGERIAEGLFPGAFLALFGGLGAGKTAFSRGVGRGLGILGVTSPTFTLVYSYEEGRLPLHHFDVYRLSSAEELYEVGFEEYLADGSAVLMEWPEHVLGALPPSRLDISILGEGTQRRFLFTPRGKRHEALLNPLEGLLC